MIYLSCDWTKISKSERRLIAEVAVELAEEVQISIPKGHFHNEGHGPLENSESLLYDLDVCFPGEEGMPKPLPAEEIRKVIMEKVTPGPSVKQVLASYIGFRADYLGECLPTCKEPFVPPEIYSKVMKELHAEGYVSKRNAYGDAENGYQWTNKIAPVMVAIAMWGDLPTREENFAKLTHKESKEYFENDWGYYNVFSNNPYAQAKLATYEECITSLKGSLKQWLSKYPQDEQELILKEFYEYYRETKPLGL
mgnify:FL=1